jgi:hypothetical protein
MHQTRPHGSPHAWKRSATHACVLPMLPQSLELQDDKLSGLFSIVKTVHIESTSKRLQVRRDSWSWPFL